MTLAWLWRQGKQKRKSGPGKLNLDELISCEVERSRDLSHQVFSREFFDPR